MLPPEKRRPQDSAFKQQRMWAWQPVFRTPWVLALLVAVFVVFLAVGIAMLVGSNTVNELVWDYTQCVDTVTQKTCASLLQDFRSGYTNTSHPSFAKCQCVIPVSISGIGSSSAALFYALGNYYQNRRLFTSSRWNPQLRSITIGGGPECDNFQTEPGTGKPYAPCGQLANAMFNDTIRLHRYAAGTLQQPPVGLSGQRISWAADRANKFKNPSRMQPLCNYSLFSPAAVAKPINWPVHACELGSDVLPRYNPWSPAFGSSGVGYENEDFIIWMRVAATPYFRKLYRFITESLPDGNYALVIDYNYPVTQFSGTKSVVISTDFWMGGQNVFLGVVYIIVACLSLLALVWVVVMDYLHPVDSVKAKW